MQNRDGGPPTKAEARLTQAGGFPQEGDVGRARPLLEGILNRFVSMMKRI